MRTNSYPVSGLTPSVIAHQLAVRGPGPYAAQTTYAVTYGHTARLIGQRCFAQDIWVKATVDIELPAWNEASAAGGATRRYWRTTISGLRRHEQGHVKIAEATARDVMRSLAHLRGAPSCEAVARLVDHRALQRIHRGQIEQRAYDVRTAHGLQQWLA